MVFKQDGCVYIMTNKRHSVLYTGVTSDILGRVWEHKNKIHPNSFNAKYNCNKLVYYAFYPRIKEAIAFEKAIKGSSKAYKQKLIDELNSNWLDMYDALLNE